jgi:hypothetical protein
MREQVEDARQDRGRPLDERVEICLGAGRQACAIDEVA